MTTNCRQQRFLQPDCSAARTSEGAALREAMNGIQALADMLPYCSTRSDRGLPVGLRRDRRLRQATAANTAPTCPTSLSATLRAASSPARQHHARPNIFRAGRRIWARDVAPASPATSMPTAISTARSGTGGHYSGRTCRRGREATRSSPTPICSGAEGRLSVFLAKELRRRDYYSAAQLRALRHRILARENNNPRAAAALHMMQLMQWLFLDRGCSPSMRIGSCR